MSCEAETSETVKILYEGIISQSIDVRDYTDLSLRHSPKTSPQILAGTNLVGEVAHERCMRGIDVSMNFVDTHHQYHHHEDVRIC